MAGRILGILLVLTATTVEAFGQLFLKKSSAHTQPSLERLWLVAGVFCFALEALVWTFVLKNLEVSIAYPMGSLSFVMVCLLSTVFLHERLDRNRIIGVALILLGTGILGFNGE